MLTPSVNKCAHAEKTASVDETENMCSTAANSIVIIVECCLVASNDDGLLD